MSLLPVEKQMMLVLENELYSQTSMDRSAVTSLLGSTEPTGSTDIKEYFRSEADNNATDRSVGEKNVKRSAEGEGSNRSSKRSRLEDGLSPKTASASRYDGMRYIQQENSVHVAELPFISDNYSDVHKSGSILKGSKIKNAMHCLVFSHLQIRQQINIFEEYEPAYVILLDADVAAIRQLEVYSANQRRKVQVSLSSYSS